MSTGSHPPGKMRSPSRQGLVYRAALILVSIGFGVWCGLIIFRSSALAIDGRRYFVLFDDAMISMRYAWNLAHGNGLVWNVGERVEGYTNLLMTLLMAVGAALFNKNGAVLLVQLMGIPVILGVAYQMSRAAALLWRDTRAEHFMRTLAYVGALSFYPLCFWTLMGMETGLVTLLVSCAVVAALKFIEQPARRSLLLCSLALGLATLARPDSMLASGLIFLYLTVLMLRAEPPGKVLRRALGPILLYLAFPFGQAIFRLWYYGALLPNTYLLKATGMPVNIRITNGLQFVTPFLQTHALLIAVVMVAGLLRIRRTSALFPALFGILLAYQIWIGGDAWSYWRLLTPAMPVLLLAALTALHTGAQRIALTSSRLARRIQLLKPASPAQVTDRGERTRAILGRAAVASMGIGAVGLALGADRLGIGGYAGFGLRQTILAAAGLLLVVLASLPARSLIRLVDFTMQRYPAEIITALVFATLVIQINLPFVREITFQERPYTSLDNERNLNAAIALTQVTTHEASIGVYWAGTIPYYTGRYAIDFLGKSDPHIARLPPDLTGAIAWNRMTSVPGHNKYDLEYSILQRSPTYVQSFIYGTQDFSRWADGRYANVLYQGVRLRLKNGSDHVLWARLNAQP